MDRRDFLLATGVAVAGSAGAYVLLRDDRSAAVAHPGSLDATFATNGDYPSDEDPSDGRPPAFPNPPATPDADPSTFDTLSVNGQ